MLNFNELKMLKKFLNRHYGDVAAMVYCIMNQHPQNRIVWFSMVVEQIY